MAEGKEHKAGFVNIVGKPNAGKSTLINQVMGKKVAIITPKAQTTRHRIMGIVNGKNYQVVYSDTPGMLDPQYEMHKSMMRFVNEAFEDADMILFVTDVFEEADEKIVAKLNRAEVPVIVLINKMDLVDQEKIDAKVKYWRSTINAKKVLPISALKRINIDKLMSFIVKILPEHPAFFPKDQLSDKPERFFAAEIIREKIFENCKKEVPYSTEVAVRSFKEDDKILHIQAEIFVERDTQKGIIIGKGGEMLKKIGTTARKDLERFFGKKVFLEQHVRVEKDWRTNKSKLKKFGL